MRIKNAEVFRGELLAAEIMSDGLVRFKLRGSDDERREFRLAADEAASFLAAHTFGSDLVVTQWTEIEHEKLELCKGQSSGGSPCVKQFGHLERCLTKAGKWFAPEAAIAEKLEGETETDLLAYSTEGEPEPEPEPGRCQAVSERLKQCLRVFEHAGNHTDALGVRFSPSGSELCARQMDNGECERKKGHGGVHVFEHLPEPVVQCGARGTASGNHSWVCAISPPGHKGSHETVEGYGFSS